MILRSRETGCRVTPAILAALMSLMPVVTPAAVTLNRVSSAEPNSLDPHIATGNTASSILYDLFVGLTTFDAAGKLIPGAAQSWTVSKDGLTYTFKLRPGMKWSDGSPLTSADFVYSVRRALTPATASRFASFFYPVKNARRALKGEVPPEQVGVEAPDPGTVVYRLEYPAAYLLQNLASNVASPVPRRQIEALGRQWTRPGNLVSNGPFRLEEWIPNDHVTLVRNPNFFDAARVRLDAVKWYPIENQATSLRRYLAGEIDILLNFPNDQIPILRRNAPQEVKIWPGTLLGYILLNNRKPPFADQRVRRALSLAVDREAIVQKIMTPGTPLAHVLTPPAVAGYEPPAPDYAKQSPDQRLIEARRLLTEAGLGQNKPLAFDLIYMSLEENRRLAVALASMWQRIGVKASPLGQDLNAINKRARTSDFEAVVYTWYPPNEDPYSFLGLLETGNPANYSGYSNRAFDDMLAKANATIDPATRFLMLSKAEAVALADQPVIPLFFYVRRFLVKPYVSGFEENSRGLNLSRWISLEKK
jgi:oligopeptide transport system substrate-binding protein